MPGAEWRETRGRLATAGQRSVAARPGYDREHCDGCGTEVSRGSLRNVQVEERPRGDLSGWMALCQTCIRTGIPAKQVGPADGTQRDAARVESPGESQP